MLGLLHDHGALRQSRLAQTIGSDPSILVTMLNPLEADGLVSRERDSEDRRRHLVTLTAAGEQHLGRATQAQREAEDAFFVGLDDEQIAALCTYLRSSWGNQAAPVDAATVAKQH